ncbi:hypothetical protein SBA4_3400017 [Candidatus Sulfopaludibacter sp. SbA4]|nr:hypothetical protein SBA4_3400017 [Candidatus Sulfopaludibacter sp. SbA4]
MGYADFGNIYLVRIFGHYLIQADRGCASYCFHLEYAGIRSPAELRPQDNHLSHRLMKAGSVGRISAMSRLATVSRENRH